MGLTNSDYEAVMREYDSIRYKNARLLKERTEEVFDKIPGLKALDDEIISDFAKLAKASLFLSKEVYAKQKKELDKKAETISLRKKELLVNGGFSEDYLEHTYNCPICKDRGFTDGVKCSCFKAMAAKHIYANPTYMMADRKADFKCFRDDYYSDELLNGKEKNTARQNALEAFSKLKAMADDFESTTRNFVIYGGVGVGKTFLASCLANSLIESGYSVVFLTAFRFFDIFEKYTFHRDGDDDSASISSTAPIFDCDLLVVDDIGTEVSNSFTTSKLFDCINERILRNKSTVISTNLSPALIKANYSDRIFSRLVGNYTLLTLTGGDIRIS